MTPFAPLAAFLWATRRSGGPSLRRSPLWFLYLLRFVVLEPLRLLEGLRFGRAIDGHRTEDPVFILGHWRSGTSYLQTLLHLDPRFTTSTIFRSMLPDVFLLTERVLAPLLNAAARLLRVRFSIQRMPMNVHTPAEADLGLCCLGSRFSYTWGHVFPASFGRWMRERVLDPSPEAVAGWLDAYDAWQRKLSFAAGGKRVVLKSPGDTARLTWLAERYPGARFVFIHRDPTAVFHSNRYLWDVVRREHGVQHVTDAAVDAGIIEHYRALTAAYAQQRTQLGPDRLVEIHYEALRDDPVGILERVYEQLRLGPFPRVELTAFLAAAPTYPPQTYRTSEALHARLRAEMTPAAGVEPAAASEHTSSAVAPSAP